MKHNILYIFYNCIIYFIHFIHILLPGLGSQPVNVNLWSAEVVILGNLLPTSTFIPWDWNPHFRFYHRFYWPCKWEADKGKRRQKRKEEKLLSAGPLILQGRERRRRASQHLFVALLTQCPHLFANITQSVMRSVLLSPLSIYGYPSSRKLRVQ